MLSQDELIQLRALQEKAMPDTVEIHRRTLADDGVGGQKDTDVTVGTTKGRLSSTGRSPEEQMIAARVSGRQVLLWTLPALTDVKEADELVANSRRYQVIGILRRSFNVAARCVCVEVV